MYFVLSYFVLSQCTLYWSAVCTNTLFPSLCTQNRARRPGNKRPPSRQKLREAGGSQSDSDKTGTESLSSSARLTSPDTLPHLPTLTQPSSRVITTLEEEIKQETGIFSTSPSKKVTVPIDQDLFGSVEVVKPKKKQRGVVDEEDDLFAPVAPKPKPKPSGDDNLFSSGKSAKPAKPASESMFDSPPEDIFQTSGSASSRQAADDIFASTEKGAGPKKNLDELLGSPAKKEVKTKTVTEETDGKV